MLPLVSENSGFYKRTDNYSNEVLLVRGSIGKNLTEEVQPQIPFECKSLHKNFILN